MIGRLAIDVRDLRERGTILAAGKKRCTMGWMRGRARWTSIQTSTDSDYNWPGMHAIGYSRAWRRHWSFECVLVPLTSLITSRPSCSLLKSNYWPLGYGYTSLSAKPNPADSEPQNESVYDSHNSRWNYLLFEHKFTYSWQNDSHVKTVNRCTAVSYTNSFLKLVLIFSISNTDRPQEWLMFYVSSLHFRNVY